MNKAMSKKEISRRLNAGKKQVDESESESDSEKRKKRVNEIARQLSITPYPKGLKLTEAMRLGIA